MNKKKVLIGSAITLLIVSMMGITIYKNSKPVFKSVNETSVTKGTVVQEVFASGRLGYTDTKEVYAPFVAKVKNVKIKLGDQVEAGQVLFEMDLEDLNKQIDSAKKALTASQFQLDQAKISRANLLTEFQKTMTDYLAPNNPANWPNGTPTQTIAQMQANYDNAVQAYTSLLNSPDATGGISIASLENQVSQAQTNLNELQAQAKKAVVTAPRNGIVVSLNAVAGVLTGSVGDSSAASAATSSLTSGGTGLGGISNSLVTIADFDKLIVTAKVNEIDSPMVKVGQKVTVTGDAFTNEYSGTISTVAPTAVTAAGAKGEETTVEIIVDLDSPSGLKPGYNVNLSIKTLEKNDALLLPPQAIQDQSGKSIVFIIEAGLAKQHEVTVGISDEKQVEILSGLKEGEKVIIDASPSLKDGDKVKVNGQ